MASTTKIYENTTDKAINVVGVGVIAPHDRISVSTEYHAPVNLVNFPGVIDVLAEEAKGNKVPAPEATHAAAPATAPAVANTAEPAKEAPNV